jgi:hypothetical protein
MDSSAMLQLVCSIQKSNSYDLFSVGFLNSLNDILSTSFGKTFRFLMIDDIANNRRIIDEFPLETFLQKTEVNYYAYNLVVPTVNNALLIY